MGSPRAREISAAGTRRKRRSGAKRKEAARRARVRTVTHDRRSVTIIDGSHHHGQGRPLREIGIRIRISGSLRDSCRQLYTVPVWICIPSGLAFGNDGDGERRPSFIRSIAQYQTAESTNDIYSGTYAWNCDAQLSCLSPRIVQNDGDGERRPSFSLSIAQYQTADSTNEMVARMIGNGDAQYSCPNPRIVRPGVRNDGDGDDALRSASHRSMPNSYFYEYHFATYDCELLRIIRSGIRATLALCKATELWWRHLLGECWLAGVGCAADDGGGVEDRAFSRGKETAGVRRLLGGGEKVT
ncbi:hypothetical protein B296_00008980 [Ensete ventricosum]|uniref:Uncharacterized protein n=1 Tax=Ensete ventricosum TaxID=4639 RepID=A0A427A3Q4_ENSVE|nr:hypothetical protein B296_00008980 [Ensete ventricosum]